MTWSPRTDEELLAATPSEPAAYGEFYRRHERALLMFFVRRTSGPDLAADLTAEVFAAALESVSSFRGSSATAWLFGIARNILIASYRQARVQNVIRQRLEMPELVLGDEAMEQIARLNDIESGRDALDLLDALPDDQREAIRAHVLDDRNYSEIAGQLACSPSVVRQRVSRGLVAMRVQLQPPC